MKKITKDDILAQIENIDCWRYKETTTTICVITLKNGYVSVTSSACLNPTHYSEEAGIEIAKEEAIQKIWPLMGFAKLDQEYNK